MNEEQKLKILNAFMDISEGFIFTKRDLNSNKAGQKDKVSIQIQVFGTKNRQTGERVLQPQIRLFYGDKAYVFNAEATEGNNPLWIFKTAEAMENILELDPKFFEKRNITEMDLEQRKKQLFYRK